MKKILSLGVGVQSSSLYLMSLTGFIEPIDCAIFCDTKFEPQAVYDYLQYLEGFSERHDFAPIYRTQRVETREFQDWSGRWTQQRLGLKDEAVNPVVTQKIPFYVKNNDGTKGMLQRQCTRDWKVDVFTKYARREICGLNYRERATEILAEKWLGISTDEAARMKDSRDKNFINRFPLIELEFSRQDCINWLIQNGFRVPVKSACVGCPYHDDEYWSDMKENRPDEFNEAVEFDEQIRDASPTLTQKCYVHKSLKPLSEVEFSAARQSNQFTNDCEGGCGL